jgi:hypothetical protein
MHGVVDFLDAVKLVGYVVVDRQLARDIAVDELGDVGSVSRA